MQDLTVSIFGAYLVYLSYERINCEGENVVHNYIVCTLVPSSKYREFNWYCFTGDESLGMNLRTKSCRVSRAPKHILKLTWDPANSFQ